MSFAADLSDFVLRWAPDLSRSAASLAAERAGLIRERQDRLRNHHAHGLAVAPVKLFYKIVVAVIYQRKLAFC